MSYARNLARLARAGAPIVDNLQAIRDLTIYDTLYPLGVIARGHTIPDDGGGGYFNILTGQTPGYYTDDNGVTVLFTDGDGTTGAVREISDQITPEMFGADETAAGDRAACQSALDYIGDKGSAAAPTLVLGRRYLLDQGLLYDDWASINGNGSIVGAEFYLTTAAAMQDGDAVLMNRRWYENDVGFAQGGLHWEDFGINMDKDAVVAEGKTIHCALFYSYHPYVENVSFNASTGHSVFARYYTRNNTFNPVSGMTGSTWMLCSHMDCPWGAKFGEGRDGEQAEFKTSWTDGNIIANRFATECGSQGHAQLQLQTQEGWRLVSNVHNFPLRAAMETWGVGECNVTTCRFDKICYDSTETPGDTENSAAVIYHANYGASESRGLKFTGCSFYTSTPENVNPIGALAVVRVSADYPEDVYARLSFVGCNIALNPTDPSAFRMIRGLSPSGTNTYPYISLTIVGCSIDFLGPITDVDRPPQTLGGYDYEQWTIAANSWVQKAQTSPSISQQAENNQYHYHPEDGRSFFHGYLSLEDATETVVPLEVGVVEFGAGSAGKRVGLAIGNYSDNKGGALLLEDTTGFGNNSDMIMQCSVGGALRDVLRVQYGGDFGSEIPGRGVLLKSPDGLTTKRLGINDAGELTLGGTPV